MLILKKQGDQFLLVHHSAYQIKGRPATVTSFVQPLGDLLEAAASVYSVYSDHYMHAIKSAVEQAVVLEHGATTPQELQKTCQKLLNP